MSEEKSKFLVENHTMHKILGGLPIGAAKEYTADELGEIAEVVARAMSPVGQALVAVVSDSMQNISRPEMRPLTRHRARCFELYQGRKTELSAADVLEVFADKIAARKNARLAAHKERLARRQERAKQSGI